MALPVCSAIYFLNAKGDVLIHRAYRDDVGCVLPPPQLLRRPPLLRSHECSRASCAQRSRPGLPRRNMADAFRSQVLGNKDAATSPVVTLGSCSFLHTREVRARTAAAWCLARTATNAARPLRDRPPLTPRRTTCTCLC
jgi:hypothetical protein